MGVRFVKHKFEGYIEQKNWALTQSMYPVVLSLDADEALSDELRNSILEVKHCWDADGYSFNRLTSYCGKWIHHCGWYPDKKLRLWEVKKGVWGGTNPHDMVIMEPGVHIKTLNGDLMHYTFYTISEHIIQVNRFSEIKAKAKLAKGRKTNMGAILVNPLFKFVKSYFIRGGFRDGRHGFYVCSISAFSTFLTYAKLFELQREARNGK